MTRRHLATEAEQVKLRAAGWREDNEGWWYPPPDHTGKGWTAKMALCAMALPKWMMERAITIRRRSEKRP